MRNLKLILEKSVKQETVKSIWFTDILKLEQVLLYIVQNDLWFVQEVKIDLSIMYLCLKDILIRLYICT